MKHIKTFASQTLPKALLPFLAASYFSFKGEVSTDAAISFNQANQWFKSPIGDLSSSLENLNFHNNYIQFIMLALIFNMMIKAGSFVSKRLNGSNKNKFLPLSFSQGDAGLFSDNTQLSAIAMIQGFLATLLRYTLAFCVYHILGFCLISICYGSQSQVVLSHGLSRVLEGAPKDTPPPPPTPVKLAKKQLSSLSLSVGTVASSLNFDPYSIALSQDGKTAFASDQSSGKLDIIDVSNRQAPSIIGTVNLELVKTYTNKYLRLSDDGQTLFVSNFQFLEIVDVSNIRSPKILSQTMDPLAIDSKFEGYLPMLYQMSMAFSADGKTLFVGGLGLQIFNIADLSKPSLLFSNKEDDPWANDILPVTTVAMGADGKTLFYADGTLEVFDVSDPLDRKTLGSYSSASYPEGFIRSIILSQDKKTAFVTVAEIAETMIIEKLDISDPANIKLINKFEQRIATAQGTNSVFVTATPSFSHVFLSFGFEEYTDKIYGFNLMTEEFMETQRSLVENADSMVFSADHKYVFTASKNLFQIVELNLEYPNSRTFSLSESLLSSLGSEECLDSMNLSADGKTLFVVYACPFKDEPAPKFVIYNVTNASSPTIISSRAIDLVSNVNIRISKDTKRAFIVDYFNIYVWDIADLLNPKLFSSFKLDNSEGWMGVEDSRISSDGRYLISLNKLFGQMITLKILDFSASTAKEVPNVILPQADYGAKLTISSDDKILYLFVGGKFLTYDISDISSPAKLSESGFHTTGESDAVEALACSLSADNKLLAFSVRDGSLAKLHIYDVSIPSNPQFKGEFTRPQVQSDYSYSVPAISSDLSKVYLIQSSGILVVNITNPEKPKLASVMPVSKNVGDRFTNLYLSANNKVAYLKTKLGHIKIVNLVTPYTVYLNQESFYLGVKHTGTVTLFGRPTGKGYVPLDQSEHRFLKTALLDIKIIATEENTKQTLSSLPYWMTFDKESYGISIEAKKTRDLGVYTLYSAFSNKIPKSAFESVESIKNGTNSVEELITTLISMGYIDNELFITSSFGSIQNFYLPSLFNGEKATIYALLKGYYVETCTTFDILPSLKLDSTQKKLAINSPSYNQYKIEIALEKSVNDSHALFVSRPYSPLVPIIFGEKTHLTLEGTQEEINNALQHIVVDLRNRTACAGSITINDNLNPSINQNFANIVQYLEINTPPALNHDADYDLQAQIESHDLSTGTYFAFALDPKTFVDNNTEHLTYELAMEDPKKNKPTWLSFNNLEFKGTPPEEFTGRDFNFVLVARNEFKERQASFSVHIRISTGYLLKLAMKMGPYMLTLVGLLVSANKIYNILGKKFYKHPIDFFVRAGEEVNSKTIFPVLFIFEETQECQHILKHLKQKIASEVNSASISDLHLALHFVDKRTQIMDTAKIIETITSTVNELSLQDKKPLKIILNGSGLRKDLIHQLVINHLVTLHLLSGPEKDTFKVYNKIKDQWGDLIEWGANGKFVVNQVALERALEAEGHVKLETRSASLIDESSPTLQSRKTFQQHLLETEYKKEYNEDLLKNAIVSHAYFHQCMNISAIRSQIHVREKIGGSPIKEFLKMDLEATNLNSRFNVDYGISCRFENDMLFFEGVPQENFIGRTLVVQITDIRLRILKEIWIYEKDSKLNENGRVILGESSLRGKGYDAL